MNTPSQNLTATVIITTYNSTRPLRLVLLGYQHQNRSDFELLVADDGSKDETRQVVEQARAACKFPVVHVWQPDDGFQKCRILNKAIVCARSDYLIISDGDCIPRPDFVDAHIRQRQPGHYLSGSLFRLSQGITDAATAEDVEAGRLFDPDWLQGQGQPPKARQYWKVMRNKSWAGFLDAAIPITASWNGANSSCWKVDALRVNGFDERMKYGGLDREFGVRLVNAGVRPRRVRYQACCVHLEHGRGYNTDDSWNFNRAIRKESKESGRIRTEFGIDQRSGEAPESYLR